MKARFRLGFVMLSLLLAVGCSGSKKLIEQQLLEITSLQSRVGDLERQLSSERSRADRLNEELKRALSEHRENEQVLLDQIAEKSIVTVSDEALFSSGSTTLTPVGREILDRIGEVVHMYPEREILVEGHTDNVQIASRFHNRFKSNWELSSSRAHSALHYLRARHDIPPSHMAAVGYGEHRPIADNATPTGRAKNRRVVIVIGTTVEERSAAVLETPLVDPIP